MVSINFLHKGKLISNIFLETGGLVVTMDCKEFMIVGGSAGTQVGTNEGNMVLYVVDLWNCNLPVHCTLYNYKVLLYLILIFEGLYVSGCFVPSVCPSIRLSIYPSVYISIRPSVYLSIYLQYPSVHLSVCPSSICPSIYPSVYPSVYLQYPSVHGSIQPATGYLFPCIIFLVNIDIHYYLLMFLSIRYLEEDLLTRLDEQKMLKLIFLLELIQNLVIIWVLLNLWIGLYIKSKYYLELVYSHCRILKKSAKRTI